MALETLKDVTEIDGFELDHRLIDGMFTDCPVVVSGEENMILFRFQNGPIKEVGVNGCQVDTMIATARLIIDGLNKKYPCVQNSAASDALGLCLSYLAVREDITGSPGLKEK